MKQLVCEVCGGNAIKKIDDSTFECQNCGLQYTKDEVRKLLVEITGEVKIDHSDEIENYTKRAEQFEEKGDSKKAKQYYEKVLDLDADNENAQIQVDSIEKTERVNSLLKDYYVIDKKISTEECIKQFFASFPKRKNIKPDIYNLMSIESVDEAYHPFAFVKANGNLEWSAVRCDYYYENQTVYKDKWNEQKHNFEKVPQTEKVQRVNRTPVNGNEHWSLQQLVSVSTALVDGVKTNKKATIIESLEEYLDSKYSSYSVKQLNAKMLVEKDDLVKYNDTNLVFVTDSSLCEKKASQLIKTKGDQVVQKIADNAGGAHYENVSDNFYVNSSSVVVVFIPICVINYVYKGTKYSAAISLLDEKVSVFDIYPLDEELVKVDNEIAQFEEEAKKSNIGIGIGICAVGVVAMIIAAITNSSFFGISALVCWLVSLVIMIADVVRVKKAAKKKIELEETSKKDLSGPRKEFLESSSKIFIENYSGLSSISTAQSQLPSWDELVKKQKENEKIEQEKKDKEKQEIQEKKEKEKKEKIAEIKKKAKSVVIGVVIFLIIAIIGGIGANYAIKNNKYNKALINIENGNYIEAYVALDQLGDYKEATNKKLSIQENYISSQLNKAAVGDRDIQIGEYKGNKLNWILLKKEDNKALLICANSVDNMAFNSEYEKVTWETCSLRRWLNNDFYNSSFSDDEKQFIQQTTVVTDISYFNYYDSNEYTNDNIFIISKSEFDEFEDNLVYYAPNFEGKTVAFWTRTFDNGSIFSDEVKDVFASDFITSSYGHTVHNDEIGVCPAMWVSLE